MASPFVRRNIGKLRPMSAPVPDDTARLALELPVEKQMDIFFAGAIHSSIRAAGFPVLQVAAGQRLQSSMFAKADFPSATIWPAARGPG